MNIIPIITLILSFMIGPALADSHMKHHGNHGAKASSPTTHKMTKMSVKAAWARASVGKNGAAFATIHNMTGADDSLVAVESDVARKVEIHTHIKDGNIMRMRRIDHIDLPNGKMVEMNPGGHHIMLIGLKKKLKDGEKFPVTLVFEKAGKIKTAVSITKIGAMGPGGMKHGDGHGGHSGHGKMKH